MTGGTVSGTQPRVYRWIGLVLLPASIVLAALTPAAFPDLNPPTATQSEPAPEVSGTGDLRINAASAEMLAQELPGIGPAYAGRIATHRRVFGPIRHAQTLIDLGIPAPVVERIVPLVRFDP